MEFLVAIGLLLVALALVGRYLGPVGRAIFLFLFRGAYVLLRTLAWALWSILKALLGRRPRRIRRLPRQSPMRFFE